MSKLNPNKKKTPKTINERLAGGFGTLAAKQSNIDTLRRLVLANLLWENIAYADGEDIAQSIRNIIPLCDPVEVFHLALEAGTKQKLRHIPLFLAVQMCKYPEHSQYVAGLLPEIIRRADMITDFMAIYWKENTTKSISNQAKKGLAQSFYNFKEYHFAKYDRNTSIKLRDVMFLVRPKPRNKEEEELFRKIANRTLKTPDTWEVALSTGKNKKETWTRLIEEKKLGGLATLRNLRNMRAANVSMSTIEKGIKNINGINLLPLNFYNASKENSMFTNQINDCMLESYKNLPRLKGKTLLILDLSGSMVWSSSGKSDLSRLDTACVMAMLALSQCEDIELVLTAGNDTTKVCKSHHLQYPSRGFSVIKEIKSYQDRLGGGGIFTRQCLNWCRDQFKGVEFERIIVFSDSQDCDYPDKKIPKPFAKYNYICDVSAHKRGINYKGVWTAEISGWSEYFLTFISSLEGNSNNFEE